MSEETKHDRRRFLSNAAMTIAVTQLGKIALPTIKRMREHAR